MSQRSPVYPAYSVLVAAPGEQRAARLVETLYHRGINIRLITDVAESMESATQSRCFVFLTPATWNHPAIVAAVQARPQHLVAILGDAMPLPAGPWTGDPLTYSDQTVPAIEAIIARTSQSMTSPYLPQSPSEVYIPLQDDTFDQPAMRSATQPVAQTWYPPSAPSAPPPPLPAPRASRSRFSTLLGTVGVIILVIVLVIGARAVPYLLAGVTKKPVDPAYTVKVPGPGCDNGANWYKSVDAQKEYTIVCQNDAMLMTIKPGAQKVGTVFFQNRKGVESGNLPTSYTTSVIGQIISGTSTTSVGMQIYNQNPAGGILFEVARNGLWEVDRFNTNGNLAKRLAFGFLSNPPQTYALQIAVLGPTMTFTINGTQVTSVVDTTYAVSHDIALTLNGDTSETAPVSASYSNFSYQPQKGTVPSAISAAATATATVNQIVAAQYQAAVPGPGCDNGGGAWSDPTVFADTTTTIACTNGQLAITRPGGANEYGGVRFWGNHGILPNDYQVEATVTFVTNDSCAAMLTRVTSSGQYVFVICATGAWLLANSSSSFTTLQRGSVVPKSSYHFGAKSVHDQQTLILDGVPVATVTDKNQKDTDFIGLGGIFGKNGGTVSYKEFIFTPING